jgi:hypothetical protein
MMAMRVEKCEGESPSPPPSYSLQKRSEINIMSLQRCSVRWDERVEEGKEELSVRGIVDREKEVLHRRKGLQVSPQTPAERIESRSTA